MKQLKFLVLFALMATVFFACEKTEIAQTTPPVEVEGEDFTTIFRLPLTEANADNGEAGIVDSKIIEQENIQLVKPVVNNILKDLQSGKLKSYPTDDMTTEIAPEKYFDHMCKEMKDNQVGVSFSYLNQCVEVIMDGKAKANSSELTPAWLRIVWVDVDQIYPDKNFVQMKMEDLKGYMVDAPAKPSLATYLGKRTYEYYPIRVGAGDRLMGIRTHEDAVAINDLIEAGKIEEAITFYTSRMRPS